MIMFLGKFSLLCIIIIILTLLGLSESIKPECNIKASLDVMFNVDNTASMGTVIRQLQTILPELLRTLASRYPGSRFGLVSFTDKNVQCFNPSNRGYCTRIELPLTSDINASVAALLTIQGNINGITLPEDSLGGMLVTALNSNIGWRPLGTKESVVRVIITVTDDNYNQPGSGIMCPGPNPRPNDGDGDYDCLNEDFPSIAQVKSAFDRMHITPVFLTVNNQQRVYAELLQRLQRQGLSEDLTRNLDGMFDVINASMNQIVCEIAPPEQVPDHGTSVGGGGEEEEKAGGSIVVPVVSAAAGVVALAGAVAGAYVYVKRQGGLGTIHGQFEGEEGEEHVTDKEQATVVEESGFV